jgi:hypothetical protein
MNLFFLFKILFMLQNVMKLKSDELSNYYSFLRAVDKILIKQLLAPRKHLKKDDKSD